MKYLMIILISIYLIFEGLFFLQMLQQNSYNDKNRFLVFVLKNIKENLNYYALKLLFGISFLLFNSFEQILYVYFFTVCFILIYSSILQYRKHNKKLPLVFTFRIYRISFLHLALYFSLLILFINDNLCHLLGYLLLYISLVPFILIIIIYILTPIEKIIYTIYKNKALKKLAKMGNIIVIGITGSFGKTSTKMILNDILSIKYKGFATAASFNTPKGILKTINENDTIFNDYFIAEMGARKKGEIKELCKLVHPQYGIITSIGPAHLETFKNIENITNTKFELLENLRDNGLIILNKDNEYERDYKAHKKVKKLWFGINNKADAYADNIKFSSKGTTFDLYLRKQKINVSTILLGKENVYNILAASLLGYEMGLSLDQIKLGIKNIKPIPHRLEIKKNGTTTIIDDSYNSNPIGAENALSVLKLMSGKKVIITPGMVEMGKKEQELNYEFGEKMANICDKFYLIGKKRSTPISDGILKNNKNADVKVFNSFNEAYNSFGKEYENQKVTVLIENDLPDTYTEK